MDFRGNLEFFGSEDGPEADTHSGSMITTGGEEDFSGSTSGGQETEGEYGKGRD